MAQVRSLLAALLVLSLGVVVGCSESHGQSTPDAGSTVDDGGAHGLDAPTPADGGWMWGDEWPDTSTWFDAWVAPASCTAQDAQEMICPSAICDGLDSWAWDGERCVRIDCGACVGADCAHLPFSQVECEASHAACVPELCRTSGGEWLFWAEECQHYHCGERQPAECLVGMPVCDCGDGRSFDASRGGCFEDPTCPVVDPLPPQVLCASTGGAWSTGICCATRCGRPCDLDCAADACTCGPLQVFDAVRGCVDDAACHVVASGEECNAQIRCQDGLICCQHCGGAGCDPLMTCQAPVCDSDPNIDTCGNDLLAP